MPQLRVVILAAGEGTRMRSATPKVLHSVAGRPMVGHVVEAARDLGATAIVLVVPPRHDRLRQALDDDIGFVVQDPPRGTGDAAAHGMRQLFADDPPQGLVLVVNGDAPGLRSATLRALVAARDDAAGTFLTVTLDDPSGYGRIVRGDDDSLQRIVEEADADAGQRAIREVNAGIYLFEAGALAAALAALRPDNAQGELYLTDTLAAIVASGGRVSLYAHPDAEEVHGVNTRAELARAEALLRRRKIAELMAAGVTVRDPDRVSVDVDVDVGSDSVLYGGVTLEAGCTLGRGCVIYPNVRIARSTIADGVTVFDGSIIEDAIVDDDAQLGPYARLRPGAHVCTGAKVGNFVEMKKSRLGPGSKANHLTYLGDAEVGADVNIGAGTITCNYDGANKHRTRIDDGAFIGSNTALVAPVHIGRGAYVGAGSTITKDVPAAALGVARGRQVVKEGWARRQGAARQQPPAGDGARGGDGNG